MLGEATWRVRVVGASGSHVNTGRKQGPRQLRSVHPEALAAAGCSARWEMSHRGRELGWGDMLWGSRPLPLPHRSPRSTRLGYYLNMPMDP